MVKIDEKFILDRVNCYTNLKRIGTLHDLINFLSNTYDITHTIEWDIKKPESRQIVRIESIYYQLDRIEN